jgi:hypothetical protein
VREGKVSTMADDEDEIMEPDDVDPDLEGDELAEPELDAEDLEEGDDLADADDEFADDEFADDAEDDDDAASSGPARKSVAAVNEDEDEDDDMLAPDDVEADLDTILKDRLVAVEDETNEDEEEPEERGEAADRLQPKRADEQMCPNCFLLVRQTAPMCPVDADDCPLFAS